MKSKNKIPAIKAASPIIYEINTRVWLGELSVKYRKKISLSTIPDKEYDALAEMGFDSIWLMGVWKRSPAGLEIAKKNEGIMKDLRDALPDLTEDDIVGSPYCIREYLVDSHIGGEKGLAKVRKELASRGMKLILDFVPNHVAPDHPWTRSNPGFFIQGNDEQMFQHPHDFYKSGKNIFAKARDPFYPPWPDILQLKVFDEVFRQEMLKTMLDIASKCDGVRCDMAMLVMNDIFFKTWGEKAGETPAVDFWDFTIPAVKAQFPDFIFIAESYWDTESALLNQGFDFCYDKRYYDYLKEGAVRAKEHISGIAPLQERLLRFLENHDEPRAAMLFQPDHNKVLALAALTLPGAKLLHDGQLSGRTIKVPVFLSRRAYEKENAYLKKFYMQLLKILHFHAVTNGEWSFCEVSGWPDNQTCLNLLAWEWVSDLESLVIIANLSDQPAQALIKSTYPWQPGKTYQLIDVTSMSLYRRDGEEMTGKGLYVILPGWGMHAFSIEH